MAAGLAGNWRTESGLPRWRDVLVLAGVGAVMGYVVGALLDITDWVPVYRGNPTLGWLPGMDAPASSAPSTAAGTTPPARTGA